MLASRRAGTMARWGDGSTDDYGLFPLCGECGGAQGTQRVDPEREYLLNGGCDPFDAPTAV